MTQVYAHLRPLYVVKAFATDRPHTIDEVATTKDAVYINPSYIVSVERVYVFDKNTAAYIIRMVDGAKYWSTGDVFGLFSDLDVDWDEKSFRTDSTGWPVIVE